MLKNCLERLNITRSSAVAERPRDASCLSNCWLRQYYTSNAVQLNSVPFSSAYSCRLAVINKIHWCVAFRRPSFAINKRRHAVLPVLQSRRSSSHRSQTQILVENRDVQNIAINVWHVETRLVWLPYGGKSLRMWLLVSTQYMNVTDSKTDRRTDTARRHRPHLCIA